jgi:carbon-monoxide dehydrogenase medium subunit
VRDFAFHSPATLSEAFALLDEHGDDARLIAGGTAVVLLMKQSLLQPDHLVSLDRIDALRGIRLDDGELRIGALVRFREVETSELVREHASLLAEVYGRVATVRIRNAATVGGGLAHADPAQDPPAALIALDARVRLESAEGARELPVDELFYDYYETAIEPGELLTDVIVPIPDSAASSVYLKFLPRTQDDYATVAVAVSGTAEDGHCRSVRVALIAAGPTPVRATEVERALLGQPLTVDSIRTAADAVADQVDPLDDFRGSAEYKRDMAVVFTRRALLQAFGVDAS